MSNVNLDEIQRRLDELEGKTNGDGNKDDKESPFFKPEIGKAYTVRLFPYMYLDKDDPPIVVYYQHNIRIKNGTGGTRWVFCPRKTMREDCDVCDVLSTVWNETEDEETRKNIFKNSAPNMALSVLALIYEGEEPEGKPTLKIWGLQRGTYQAILELYKNPDFGLIHDAKKGNYLKVEVYKTKKIWEGKPVRGFSVSPRIQKVALTEEEKEEIKNSPLAKANLVEDTAEFRGPNKQGKNLASWVAYLRETYEKARGLGSSPLPPEGSSFDDADDMGTSVGNDDDPDTPF